MKKDINWLVLVILLIGILYFNSVNLHVETSVLLLTQIFTLLLIIYEKGDKHESNTTYKERSS